MVKLDTPSSSQTRRAAGECPHRARAGERPAGGFKVRRRSAGGSDTFSRKSDLARSPSRGASTCETCDTCAGIAIVIAHMGPTFFLHRVGVLVRCELCRVCGPAHLFSTLDLYSTASPPLMSQLNQNSMARLVEVDVLEDGLGRELD